MMASGPTDPDETLLAAARAGDRRAIEALLDRYQQRVFGYGLRMCGDEEDAKDVLQETLLAAARTVGDFRGASSVSTWLYTIARSFCIKKRRRGKHAPASVLSLDTQGDRIPAGTLAPDDQVAGGEVKRALAAALETLDPVSREVMILRDVEGLTAPEVAEVVGTSVDAVKSRLHRARAAVRGKLAETLGETGRPAGQGCPDVVTAYSRKLEGEIDASLCAELERHLEGCSACRAACDSLKRTLAVCSRSAPGPVPAPIRASVREALRAALGSG